MNAEQAFAIVRLAKGSFPATTMDEFTPEAWSLALEDDRFEDARDALKELMREQTFIHVSDIAQRIKRIRHQRVLAFGALPPPPPSIDPGDTRAMQAWEIETVRAIADGELTTDDPQPLERSPWEGEVSPLEAAAAAASRMKEIRAQLAKRAPTLPAKPRPEPVCVCDQTEGALVNCPVHPVERARAVPSTPRPKGAA